jgi:hypothetical protein
MTTPIEDLPNLGPVTRRWLADVGVDDADALREIGAVAAYVRLRFAQGRVSLNALYALHAALRGIPWTALGEEERAELRRAAEAAMPRSEPEPNPRPRAAHPHRAARKRR